MTYENKLEQWYGSCPDPVQQVLNWGGAYDKVNGWLKDVAGDPEVIMSYAPKYTELGNRVTQVSKEISTLAKGIQGWTGEAHDAFLAKTTDFSGKVTKISEALQGTPQVLEACAKGAVEVANCIIDIVKMLIEFLISSLAVSAALSVFTAGASLAAWVAGNIARAAKAIADIVRVIEKFARFLEKIAQLFMRINQILLRIKDIIKAIQAVFKGAKDISNLVFAGSKGLTGFAAKKALKTGIQAPIKLGTGLAANPLLPGDTKMPGGVSEGGHAVQDGRDAWGHIKEAREAAAKNKPQ